MDSKILGKAAVWLFLWILVVSAFSFRLENFKHTRTRSVDETVYYFLGKQFVQEGLKYDATAHGRSLAQIIDPLPQYFFAPLFKHPPLFSLLIAGAMRLFGVNAISAELVSLGMGILIIPMVYLLARRLADWRAGILAALLAWTSPSLILSSQKVWMDTSLALLTIVSLYGFIKGLDTGRSRWFLASGLMAGLAANTKYSGIIVIVAYFLFALLYQRNLLRHKGFWGCLLLPFVMLIPWFYWNYLVYGQDFIRQNLQIHESKVFRLVIFGWVFVLCAGAALAAGSVLSRSRQVKLRLAGIKNWLDQQRPVLQYGITVLFFLALVIFFKDYILRGADITHIPVTYWQKNLFGREPSYFYFGRLLEFSLLYGFGYFSLVMVRERYDHGHALTRLVIFVVMVFFIWWRNYQVRYILPAVPLLIALSAAQIVLCFDRIEEFHPPFLRLFAKSIIFLFLIYGFIKTHQVNLLFSFPNLGGYF